MSLGDAKMSVSKSLGNAKMLGKIGMHKQRREKIDVALADQIVWKRRTCDRRVHVIVTVLRVLNTGLLVLRQGVRALSLHNMAPCVIITDETNAKSYKCK